MRSAAPPSPSGPWRSVRRLSRSSAARPLGGLVEGEDQHVAGGGHGGGGAREARRRRRRHAAHRVACLLAAAAVATASAVPRRAAAATAAAAGVGEAEGGGVGEAERRRRRRDLADGGTAPGAYGGGVGDAGGATLSGDGSGGDGVIATDGGGGVGEADGHHAAATAAIGSAFPAASAEARTHRILNHNHGAAASARTDGGCGQRRSAPGELHLAPSHSQSV